MSMPYIFFTLKFSLFKKNVFNLMLDSKNIYPIQQILFPLIFLNNLFPRKEEFVAYCWPCDIGEL